MTEDPRARFRDLPAPCRPEQLVETSDVSQVAPPEQEVPAAWRSALLGAGG
ncbi:hypothetical protein SAMN05660199_02230 [Klenkia soli]|uniref:Uncharacterized protein n=1 Tax=Klenkia soli TaxID=1052260 RepID=A0A1H0KT41_9ACTN|nr:hypothetical protein [Klenkia soli]SDO58910.1 hypothetical protein SAMN05660199_02230 [Klenkia soli]